MGIRTTLKQLKFLKLPNENFELLINEFYNFVGSELFHMDSNLRAFKVKGIALEKKISSLRMKANLTLLLNIF
jgi:hypothetical protein